MNSINAAAIAEERGIRVHEEKQDGHRGGAANMLALELHTASGTRHATATVIHDAQPRLLEFDGIDVEAPLEGNLLVCRNLDVPGVIGKIGTILGEHGVNIANFALGRDRSGVQAGKGARRGAGGRARRRQSAGGAQGDRGAARGPASGAAGVGRLLKNRSRSTKREKGGTFSPAATAKNNDFGLNGLLKNSICRAL